MGTNLPACPPACLPTVPAYLPAYLFTYLPAYLYAYVYMYLFVTTFGCSGSALYPAFPNTHKHVARLQHSSAPEESTARLRKDAAAERVRGKTWQEHRESQGFELGCKATGLAEIFAGLAAQLSCTATVTVESIFSFLTGACPELLSPQP